MSQKTTSKLGPQNFDLTHVPDVKDLKLAMSKAYLYNREAPDENVTTILIENGLIRKHRRETGACHGFLADEGGDGNNISLIASFIRRPHQIAHRGSYSSVVEAQKIHETYYGWLLNDSAWAEAFVIKEVKEGMPYVFVRTDIPSNFMMSALIASRSPWEAPYKMKVWYTLVKSFKIPPAHAYVLATVSGTTRQGYLPSSFSHQHWPFSSDFSDEIINNFSRKTRASEYERPTYRESSIYKHYVVKGPTRCVFTVFGSQSSGKLVNSLLKEFSTHPRTSPVIDPFSQNPRMVTASGEKIPRTFAPSLKSYCEILAELHKEGNIYGTKD